MRAHRTLRGAPRARRARRGRRSGRRPARRAGRWWPCASRLLLRQASPAPPRRRRPVVRRGRARGTTETQPGSPAGHPARPRLMDRTPRSGYRTSGSGPVTGRHMTDTLSTRASGGPFSRSRASSSITAALPSTRTRTRPSLRFMTYPARPSWLGLALDEVAVADALDVPSTKISAAVRARCSSRDQSECWRCAWCRRLHRGAETREVS